MAKRKKRRAKPRKLGADAKANIGTPSRRKYKTIGKRRGVTPTSKMHYSTSVVEVGMSPDVMTGKDVAKIRKRVADIARKHIGKNPRHFVSLRLKTLYAKLSSWVEDSEGDIKVIDESDAADFDIFPNVGSDWEWRDRHFTVLTRDIADVRDGVLEMLMGARKENEDAHYVFIDAIEITKWTR